MDYRAKIVALCSKHQLSEHANPGGREFGHPGGGRCHVHAMDDEEDYRTLIAWLIRMGYEQPEEPR